MKSLILITFFFCFNAVAADGCADIKFGTSIEAFKKKKPCELSVERSFDKNVQIFACSDFKYAGRQVAARFYFYQNQFDRAVLTLGKHFVDMEFAASQLRDEFGSPSRMFDSSTVRSFNAGIRDQLSIGFDGDSVALNFSRSGKETEVILSYSSDDFFKRSPRAVINQFAGN